MESLTIAADHSYYIFVILFIFAVTVAVVLAICGLPVGRHSSHVFLGWLDGIDFHGCSLRFFLETDHFGVLAGRGIILEPWL